MTVLDIEHLSWYFLQINQNILTGVHRTDFFIAGFSDLISVNIFASSGFFFSSIHSLGLSYCQFLGNAN